MSSQTRISKRKHSTVEPDSSSPSRASQRMRKPTTKLLQGTLGFPSRLSQVSTLTKSLTPVSQEQSQASTRQNSLSPTPQSGQSSKSREPKDTTISSKRRTWWEIDFDLNRGPSRVQDSSAYPSAYWREPHLMDLLPRPDP